MDSADPVRPSGFPAAERLLALARGPALPLSAALAVFCFAPSFAAGQELWGDEATQLGGLTLGPMEVARWLAGEDAGRFGVPGDRMPPLSYWVGSLWAAVFGLTEGAMRALGILLVAAAAAIVALAGRRLAGPAAGAVAGLAMAWSPSVVSMAAEIRAYPLFLLCSAAAFLFLGRLVEDPVGSRRRDWAGLATACILASWTHLFGLLLTGSVFLAAGAIVVRAKAPRKPWLAAAAACVAAAAGLLPFIRGAAQLSAADGPAGGLDLGGFGRLAYRLLGGHPSVQAYAPVLVAVVGGMIALLGLSLGGAARRSPGLQAVFIALASGLTVAVAVRLATRGFNAVADSYNLWAVPGVAIAAGAAVSLPGRLTRAAARTAAVSALTGLAAASALLASRAEVFAHTPSRRIEREVRARGGPAAIAVLHDCREGAGFGFFPLRHTFGRELPQYLGLPAPDGSLEVTSWSGVDNDGARTDLPLRPLLVLSHRSQYANQTVAYLRHGTPPQVSAEAIVELLVRAGWKVDGRRVLIATAAAEAVWMIPPSPSTP